MTSSRKKKCKKLAKNMSTIENSVKEPPSYEDLKKTFKPYKSLNSSQFDIKKKVFLINKLSEN